MHAIPRSASPSATLLASLALAAGGVLGPTMGTTPAFAATPVTFTSGPAAVPLIELFSSEGCSSCPPAERWLGELAKDKGLWHDFVPVAFHVNYWDRLGWKDVFAKPAYTERQYAYAAAWSARTVYTPGFVFQGREWRSSEPRPAIAPAGQLELVRTTDGTCSVRFTPLLSPDSARNAPRDYEVQLALLGGGIASPVKAGENSGRTLHHEFVAYSVLTAPLTPAAEAEPGDATTYTASFPPAAWPATKLPEPTRRALIAWVSRRGEPTPLQATGGWLAE